MVMVTQDHRHYSTQRTRPVRETVLCRFGMSGVVVEVCKRFLPTCIRRLLRGYPVEMSFTEPAQGHAKEKTLTRSHELVSRGNELFFSFACPFVGSVVLTLP